MVHTDDEGHIPAINGEFMEIFSKDDVETLPPHRPTDHAIHLEPGYFLPDARIYNLSEFELMMLKDYVQENLANGFIQRSSSQAAVPILFARKMDGGLRLCVDYRMLNLATVKNQYPLPLISELLDSVREARIFTTLDLRSACNLIRIKEGEKYKTAFQRCYGQFEYRIMPFGLTISPATFQSYIDDFLWPYIEDLAVYHLDDLLIYSTNEKGHEEHVRQVRQRLKEFGL